MNRSRNLLEGGVTAGTDTVSSGGTERKAGSETKGSCALQDHPELPLRRRNSIDRGCAERGRDPRWRAGAGKDLKKGATDDV